MAEQRTIIPVWLFVGIILFLYGIIIFGTGIYQLSNLPDTVLANVRAPLWWGGCMAAVGAIYVFLFWPGRNKSDQNNRNNLSE